MVTSNSFPETIDWMCRLIESLAFSIHALLGLSEPFTGCLRKTFNDRGAMPNWFWPTAGCLLIAVSCGNFSGNNVIVLACQAYIAAFHSGGVFYHRALGDHPIAGVAPGVFVIFPFIITNIRLNVFIATVGTAVCVSIAYLLSKILIRPIDENRDDHHGELLPEERARMYLSTN